MGYMDVTSSRVSYEQVAYFSKIVLDYLQSSKDIEPFYEHPVSMDGIRAAIAARKNFSTNRAVLVDQLDKQYEDIKTDEKVLQHISALKEENTFTVVTAHQPNIFTGHLYFIYKIIHTIRLANRLSHQMPDYRFVPVFYMEAKTPILTNSVIFTSMVKSSSGIHNKKVPLDA